MNDGSPLGLERLGEVLHITFARPKAANSLNQALHRALVTALTDAAGDDSVRAVLLTGAGGRVFSAGVDLKEFSELPATQAAQLRRDLLRESFTALTAFEKPILACVQGAAVGAGCMVAMLADEVLASDDARFSLPEVRLGMPTPVAVAIADACGGLPLVRSLVLAGGVLEATDAKAAGMVAQVLPGTEVATTALERARMLAAFEPAAYAHTKRWSTRALRAAVADAFDEADRIARETR